MKHCSVMFCATPVGLCLAAPAVARWPREEARKTSCVSCAARHSANDHVKRARWRREDNYRYGGIGPRRACTHPSCPVVVHVQCLPIPGRQASTQVDCCGARAASIRMAAGISCFPTLDRAHAVQHTQGHQVQTTRRRRDDCGLPPAHDGHNRPINPTRGIPHRGRAWVGRRASRVSHHAAVRP